MAVHGFLDKFSKKFTVDFAYTFEFMLFEFNVHDICFGGSFDMVSPYACRNVENACSWSTSEPCFVLRKMKGYMLA